MRNRRDDLRNIALILGAGAVGVLGTVFVTQASKGPAVELERAQVRQQAVVEAQQALAEAMERAQEAREIVVTGTAEASEDRASIRIRGVSGASLRARPVIYIDGVRVNGSQDEALDLVKPDQVDRIEVLKGDAARQRYGSEAANGVIQIFTKSGEEASGKEDDRGP